MIFYFLRSLRISIVLGAIAITVASYSYLASPVESCHEFFNVHPTNEHVSYLYAPGIMATEMAMGRYSPQFTAVTGEKFTFKKGGHVIGEPHTAIIFPEIDLRKPGYFTLNPITAYINRIRNDLYPLFFRIFTETYEFDVEETRSSEVSVVNYGFNFGQANMGQTKDIKAVYATYQDHLKRYPDTQIVLYGDSRGAATMFNFLAEYHPKQVKAAILESPFDDMDHYIKHLFYIDKPECSEERLHSIYSLILGSYKRNGPCPRKYAEIITDDVPLLFVTSVADGLVHSQCVFNLYNRLKERGHKKIHILVLKKSSHPCYMLDDKADKELYEAVVHAFYAHYNLPHNSAKAQAGYYDFIETQPSIVELAQKYDIPRCSKCWQLN